MQRDRLICRPDAAAQSHLYQSFHQTPTTHGQSEREENIFTLEEEEVAKKVIAVRNLQRLISTLIVVKC